MVTSTSTPASMLTMICLTTSVGALRLLFFGKVSQLSFFRPRGRNMMYGDVLNQALVDAHLVQVPGLGTLTARGLTGGDLEVLGGQADGALDGEVLALGALDQLGADLLEGLHLARGQGDADLVGLLYGGERRMVSQQSIAAAWYCLSRQRRGVRKGSTWWARRKRTGASKSPPFSGLL